MDANVLSEITRPSPAPQVLDWLANNEAELAVNPVILGEIEYGILLLEYRSVGPQRFYPVSVHCGPRVIPVTSHTT